MGARQFVSSVGVVAVLASGASAISAGTAAAAPVGCGSVITQSTTLTRDIGPCNQGGLVIGADNVTLDLGGHTVMGKARSGDGVGVSIVGHSGVTVTDGTVEAFDAGVQIMGGGGNTVTALTAKGNVGVVHFNSKFGVGDGIEIDLSSDNTVSGDTVLLNGPFSGISVVGDASNPSLSSSGNVITDNQVTGNSVPHNGINEDDGIRVEGPNATGTMVQGNTVSGNGLDGIAVFADQLTGFPNDDTTVSSNTVQGNGFHSQADRPGDGIVLFGAPGNPSVGGADFTTVDGNTVDGNASNGILVESTSNTVTSNNATGNAVYPGVTAYDLNDANPGCDANVWSGNLFATSNQTCIS